jgi:hypothetical protein
MKYATIAWLAVALTPGAVSSTEKNLPFERPVELDVRHWDMFALPIQGARRIRLSYEATGYFSVECAPFPANAEPGWQPTVFFRQEVAVCPGRGSCMFDLRRTIDWEPPAQVMLILRGTGRFIIRGIVADFLESKADPVAEKRWALFWVPERVRHTTINTVTPVFWNATTLFPWTRFWGIVTTVALMVAAAAAALSKRLRQASPVAVVACASLLVYQSHWLVRSWDMFHKRLWMSTEEKIRRNYFEPEFGEIAVKARELIPERATVLIAGHPRDWYAPQCLAFNLASRRCGYSPDGTGRFLGIGGYSAVTVTEADYYICYYSDKPEPLGFKRIFELHPQVYIAQRSDKLPTSEVAHSTD